jgi:hypothetical protein
MRQTLGHVPDCIRILIQSQNIGAAFYEALQCGRRRRTFRRGSARLLSA